MKINDYLNTNIKKMSGNVLGIGIDQPKLLDSLKLNKNITECNLLDSYSKTSGTGGRGKKVRLSKLRKKFKKKNVDYFICRYESVPDIIDILIRDSIYISKNYIYIYGFDKEKLEKIKKKYNRYKVDIEKVKCSDGIVLKIECSKAKNHFLKEKKYKMIDFFGDIIEIVTELLIN